MSILNKYKRWNPLLVLSKKNIWDFVLNKNNQSNNINDIDKTITHIDLRDNNCVLGDNTLLSKKESVWENAISENVILKNIGLTGIDSGFISYRKDKISNEEFTNILTNSEWHNYDNDLRLKLHPVYSNTRTYSFPYEFINDEENYLKLNGGFFQGFFKSNNTNYQVLPDKIEKSIEFSFKLRPMDYEEKFNSLNCINKNNKGIFFYIGTRSENKFIQTYDYDLSNFKVRNIENDSDFLCDTFYEGYVKEEINKDIPYDNGNFFEESYILDDKKTITSYFDEREYIHQDIIPTTQNIKDENEISLNENGYYEIKTDNKYLFFNNTKDGYNVETWNENDEIVLTGITSNNTDNLYLLLNNTETGYTTQTISNYYEKKTKELNIEQDIVNNAFALKLNDDGSVGYRYMVSGCGEKKYEIIEEKSLPNIIKKYEWNYIRVVIENITKNNLCSNMSNNHKMVIKIYVDEKLKFVSKEIPMLNLRSLNELEHRQEGVAYNISLGGGTMGLCDSIWLDYYIPFKYILPIEEYFAGTFIGDIQLFKISYNN